MTRKMLAAEQIENIIKFHFKDLEKNQANVDDESVWIEKNLTDCGSFKVGITYFYNAKKNAVIIACPLLVSPVVGAIEATYAEIEDKICSLPGYQQISISGVLLAKGATERHYVAFHHQSANSAITIFDSKISNMNRFLSSSDIPNFFERIIGYVMAPIKTIGFALGFGKQVKARFHGHPVDAYRLGTQPMLDGVSCGYHSAGAIVTLVDTLSKREPVHSDGITNPTANSADTINDVIFRHKDIYAGIADKLLEQSQHTTPPISRALGRVSMPQMSDKSPAPAHVSSPEISVQPSVSSHLIHAAIDNLTAPLDDKSAYLF